MTVLAREEWWPLAKAHRAEVEAELADVVARRDRGQKHPIDDFLFQYYNLRPSHLAQWHPGIGIGLLDAQEEYGSNQFYRQVDGAMELDVEHFLAKRGGTVETAHTILSATLAAPARFGCFGMHEWAMVYRLEPGETRHPYLRLRFPPDELAAIVEEVGCRCSHFDAFRFFTEPARPLNLITPTRQRQAELDQPGCLHVNMDLYKWAGKLTPAAPSTLVFEAFVLAREIRVMDMRASAYDLADWGLDPIRVETSEGRSQYATLQRSFAARAEPIRRRLQEETQTLVNRIRCSERTND